MAIISMASWNINGLNGPIKHFACLDFLNEAWNLGGSYSGISSFSLIGMIPQLVKLHSLVVLKHNLSVNIIETYGSTNWLHCLHKDTFSRNQHLHLMLLNNLTLLSSITWTILDYISAHELLLADLTTTSQSLCVYLTVAVKFKNSCHCIITAPLHGIFNPPTHIPQCIIGVIFGGVGCVLPLSQFSFVYFML